MESRVLLNLTFYDYRQLTELVDLIVIGKESEWQRLPERVCWIDFYEWLAHSLAYGS